VSQTPSPIDWNWLVQKSKELISASRINLPDNATGWKPLEDNALFAAIARTNRESAEGIVRDCISDFRSNGIYECINEGYAKLENYVVSATNPLMARSHIEGG